MSPRWSTSARAWRTSSATRCWRCEGPVEVGFWAILSRAGAGTAGSRPEKKKRRPRQVPRPPCPELSGISEGPADLLDPVALDGVARAHVLEVLEGHAALLAGGDFLRVVLEPLEGLELALVDHDAVADEADMGAA